MDDGRYIQTALDLLDPKPPDTARSQDKKGYSEKLSAAIAHAIAQIFRNHGLSETRPAPPGEFDKSGAERRIFGGIGDKKVDVTWAIEEAGLLLGASIKTINFRDGRTGNFQKNLTNRRGDMLFESVTLHRRFPYAVLAGFFIFDKDAATDSTKRRNSTFSNAHMAFRMFTNRSSAQGPEEQYERMYICLCDANRFRSSFRIFAAGAQDDEVSIEAVVQDLLTVLAERNADSFQVVDGKLIRIG